MAAVCGGAVDVCGVCDVCAVDFVFISVVPPVCESAVFAADSPAEVTAEPAESIVPDVSEVPEVSELSMPVSGSVVTSLTVSAVLSLHDTHKSTKKIKQTTDNIFLQFFIIQLLSPILIYLKSKFKNSFLILIICGFL